jgi:hypothetical protein
MHALDKEIYMTTNYYHALSGKEDEKMDVFCGKFTIKGILWNLRGLIYLIKKTMVLINLLISLIITHIMFG